MRVPACPPSRAGPRPPGLHFPPGPRGQSAAPTFPGPARKARREAQSRPARLARTTRGAPASRTRARRPRSEPRGPRSSRAHLPPPRTAGYVAGAAARPPRLCSRLAGGSGARDFGARRPLPPGSRILLPNPNAGPGHAAPCALRSPCPGRLARPMRRRTHRGQAQEAARPEAPRVNEPVNGRWRSGLQKQSAFLCAQLPTGQVHSDAPPPLLRGEGKEGLGSPCLENGY